MTKAGWRNHYTEAEFLQMVEDEAGLELVERIVLNEKDAPDELALVRMADMPRHCPGPVICWARWGTRWVCNAGERWAIHHLLNVRVSGQGEL